MATIVAIASDLHCNSTLALCPPSFNLDDGGTYRASPQQKFLWRKWSEYCATVAERRTGHRLAVILNGELADNNYHPTTQLVTRNPADMMRLSAAVLKPLLATIQDGDLILVTRGTEAHSGPSASLDEAIAQDIGATGPSPDIASHWRLRATLDGVRFDVAHHPPGGGGRLPWTRGTFANRLAAMTIFDSAEAGGRAPHLLIRGHVHRPDDSYDRYATRALVLPSWQLTTSYGHRIGGDPLPIGGLIVTCDAGRYTVEKHYHNWIDDGFKTL